MSGTITLYFGTGESCTWVTLEILDKLDLSVLLGTNFIYKVIRSIHPAKRKLVPQRSPPIPILVVNEHSSADEKDWLNSRQNLRKVRHCS